MISGPTEYLYSDFEVHAILILRFRGPRNTYIAISGSHFLEDVSGETLIFENTSHSRAPWTSPFFKDVSDDSHIFEHPEIKSPMSTSPFFKDVTGETLIFNKHVLRYNPHDRDFVRTSQAKRPFRNKASPREQHLTRPGSVKFCSQDDV